MSVRTGALLMSFAVVVFLAAQVPRVLLRRRREDPHVEDVQIERPVRRKPERVFVDPVLPSDARCPGSVRLEAVELGSPDFHIPERNRPTRVTYNRVKRTAVG